MTNSTIVKQAAKSLRETQTGLSVRKESLSSLVALIAWVCVLIAENIDSIPDEAGIAGQILAVACSVAAVSIARFTIPALTRGQEAQLVSRAETIQALQEARLSPAALPVYQGESTAPAGRHHAGE